MVSLCFFFWQFVLLLSFFLGHAGLEGAESALWTAGQGCRHSSPQVVVTQNPYVIEQVYPSLAVLVTMWSYSASSRLPFSKRSSVKAYLLFKLQCGELLTFLRSIVEPILKREAESTYSLFLFESSQPQVRYLAQRKVLILWKTSNYIWTWLMWCRNILNFYIWRRWY